MTESGFEVLVLAFLASEQADYSRGGMWLIDLDKNYLDNSRE
jgi:hypothetical protein